MSTLSDLHIDALSEVFNVGAGRAAASLSEIVGEEVKLSVPSVEVLSRSSFNTSVLALEQTQFGSVTQRFSGPFNADAILLFTEESAMEIVRDMMGSQLSIEELAEFEQEAMCELGNIILNACLSAMADMLTIKLSSTLPTYNAGNPDEILNSVFVTPDQLYILILHINLRIERRHVEGNLIFLLSTSSLTSLKHHIDTFLQLI